MENLAVVMVLGAAVIWGGSGIFIHVLTAAGLTSPQMTAIRLITVFFVMLAVILLTDRSKLRVRPKDLVWFALNGFLGVFVFSLCYTFSIQLTSMATAAVLIYLMPSLVMLYSVIFGREAFTGRKAACLMLSFAGCALVSGVGSSALSLSAAGLAFGLVAALCYAAYSIITGTPLHRYSSMTTVLYTFFFAGVFAVLYAVFFGDMGTAVAIYVQRPEILAFNILTGVVCSNLAYLLYNTALRYIPASKAAILATVEPAAAAVFGLVCFGEALSPLRICGILCELGALILLQLPARQKGGCHE